MHSGPIAALREALIAFLLRRIRMITILLVIGVGWLILTQDASWTTIAIVTAVIVTLAFGWLSVLFWVWVLRNVKRRSEG